MKKVWDREILVSFMKIIGLMKKESKLSETLIK